MHTLLIKNGTIVDTDKIFEGDLYIQDGLIAKIEKKINETANDVIDATKMFVFPGAIETNSEFSPQDKENDKEGEKGKERENKKEINSLPLLSHAALLSGTTTLLSYILTKKGQSLSDAFTNFNEDTKDKSYTDFGAHIALSDVNETILSEMQSLLENQGINSFRVPDSTGKETLEKIFKKASEIHAIISMRPPPEAINYVQEFIETAEKFKALSLITDVYSNKTLLEIKKARARLEAIFAETSPKYLVLDEETKIENKSLKDIMPIKTGKDREGLWSGLRADIQILSSGHRPESVFSSLENRFEILFSEGVLKRNLALTDFVKIMSANPAKLFGLYPKKGNLNPSSHADIVILDPNKEKTYNQSNQILGTTCFTGLKVKGSIEKVILRGKLLINDGKLIPNAPLIGQYQKRSLPLGPTSD